MFVYFIDIINRATMKKHFTLPLVLLFFLLAGCASPKYIHETSSFKRQEDLRQARSANVLSDIFIGFSTACLSAALETEIEFYPTDQQFKKLKLVNPTNDTMYVNMLTDVFWDKDNYCDFMDIRIPPHMKCKVMVPLEANYNIYFSNTPESDDDEMLEIFTTNKKRISLKPGMTIGSAKNKK